MYICQPLTESRADRVLSSFCLKGRKRPSPYEPDDPIPIVIDNPLMRNVPDFSMLHD